MTDLIELVKFYEGFHKRVDPRQPLMAFPYLCPAGFWTIGWGHVCRQDHPSIDQAEGEQLLKADLFTAASAVIKLTNTALSPHQLEALTSWTFNLGSARYRASTMRACINRGELDRVPAEMRRWVYAGTNKLPGLVARREAEIELWRTI